MSLGPGVEMGRVLVLGDYRQTVTVVRSLGRAGFEVTLGTDQRASSTGLSRLVSDVWIYDSATPQAFCNNLEAFLRSERPDFVFAVGDSQLRTLMAAAPRLKPLSTWVNADFATLARCFDEDAMGELASRLGVPAPPSSRFTSADDWRERALAMGYPVVVKRKASAARAPARKVLALRDPAQLDAFLAGLPDDPEPASLLLQKLAPGVRHSCHVAAADGRLLAFFQERLLRTGSPDDMALGVAGESVAPAAVLRAHCEALLEALRYTGIACIQFMLDERSCSVAFLQFNAGTDGAVALPYRLGVDFPLLAVRLAAYQSARAAGDEATAARIMPATRPFAYAQRETYHCLHGDLDASFEALRSGALPPGALPARVLGMAWLSLTSHHLTFDWRDPLPALHMLWRKYLRAPPQRRVPLRRPVPR